jgi:beta-galactosidase/beta-glucuronidase
VQFECGAGVMEAGDWSRIEGLSSYSGGAWYRKTVSLTEEQARGSVALDLGVVSASAEVRVNGKPVGVRLAPPYRVDVSGLVTPGANRIEILVYSALSNHYRTIPTRYLSPSPSGLVGPVQWVIRNRSTD